MSILTTTIGAYPKPSYMNVPDWFVDGVDNANPTRNWTGAVDALGSEAEAVFTRGARDVVHDQVNAGIDIPTDGEIRRENYIHYHCRHLNGVDFKRLAEKDVRGVYKANLPTITGPISPMSPFLLNDWKVAQGFTDRPVKITMPGPVTVCDTTVDKHYGDPRRLGADLADALNAEVLALAEAGCKHIQIDEPVFARNSVAALEYGIEHLDRAFHRCPKDVVRTVHICCGYPDVIDSKSYPKAPREAYFQLADALEASTVDAVSLEDAHRHNDLALLERFSSTTIVLGVIAIARSRIETVEEITQRLQAALGHIDRDRLIAAPDCGLGFLDQSLVLAKLGNLCEAAHSLP